MDEAGIAMQVLSAMTPGAQELPGAEGVAFARRLNRWISGEVVSRWPDRFRAFAALQCLRMIVAGVFDRFPDLQIVVGHMGEGLPFWYWRLGDDLARATKDRLRKPVQQYLHDNFRITTSAFFRDELLALALSVMGEDRVIFAVDYPFASNGAGAEWLRSADLPRRVKEKIASGNARRLLNVGP